MKRLAFVLGTGLVLTGGSGCSTSSGPSSLSQVIVAPVLDSLFVGDSLGPLTVTYLGDNGQPQNARTEARHRTPAPSAPPTHSERR